MPQMGYDTKTDRLTVSRNVTLTLNVYNSLLGNRAVNIPSQQ
jgi:hypothetical protein